MNPLSSIKTTTAPMYYFILFVRLLDWKCPNEKISMTAYLRHGINFAVKNTIPSRLNTSSLRLYKQG